jgi:hypothetical protein
MLTICEVGRYFAVTLIQISPAVEPDVDECYSAWGLDADRHDKSLIDMTLEGSCFGADLQ